MKAVFVHDNRYIKNGNDIYAEQEFSAESWSPYLEHFDELIVIGRDYQTDKIDIQNCNLCSRGGVSFVLLPALTRLKNYLFKRQHVAREIKNVIEQCDAVILRGVQENAVLAFRGAKTLNIPVFLEGTGCMWNNTWHYGTITGKLYAPFRFLNARRVFQGADAVLYVTEKFLQRRYPTRGMHTGVSDVRLQKPDSAVLKTRIKRIKNQNPKAALKFGIIGSVHHKHKGIDNAIKALSIWHKKTTHDFSLHILGRGNPARLKKLAIKYGIESKVFFDGVRRHEEVPRWLDGLDIYLQPSRTEGLPRATLEAMSRALPVIASDAGDLASVIEKSLIHPRCDYKKLASLIEKLSSDHAFIQEQAQRNFNLIKTKFDPQKAKTERQKFWDQFIALVTERKPDQTPLK